MAEMTTVSAAALAVLVNIGERHVRKLVHAGHIPAPVARGQYDRDAHIFGTSKVETHSARSRRGPL